MNMTAPSSGRATSFLTARPIAHRGLHDPAKGVIENTASAFAAAIAGNYAIECDLQITRDSEAVVFHDEELGRITEGQGLVKDLTAAEIKALTIRGTTDHVQTLAELLAQVDGKVPLVIELKSHWDGDLTLVNRALAGLRDYRGLYGLMSFDPNVIAAVREASPQTIRGIVADRAFDPFYETLPLQQQIELRTFGFMRRAAPDFISFYFDELPHAPVTAFRASGKPVISWTIRSAEQARTALRQSDQITFEGFIA